MRIVPVFVLTILATMIFPVMSQGIHGSCREGFIKIAKFNENSITPLTSCVTPNMVERFSELGWQVVPQNSSVLAIFFEKAKRCGETITEEIAQANKCPVRDKNCYSLQEPMLECLGEKVTAIVEEAIEDIEVAIQEVDEVIEKIEE